MSEDSFRKNMKNLFDDLESLTVKIVKAGTYTSGSFITETDTEIYSYITEKTYSSEKEYKKDLRKFKLNKINVL